MILFILTSHRLDCFRLCIDCLERHTDLKRFGHVYVLANAPEPDHLAAAKAFVKRHGNAHLVEFGPRGMGPLMAVQDAILAKHKGEALVKIDEDVFVMPFWLEGLVKTHEAWHHAGCRLVSALVPNNDAGRVVLHDNLMRAHAEYAAKPEWHGLATSQCAGYAAWLWQAFCAGELAFDGRGLLNGLKTHTINVYLNINCILVDPEMLEVALPFTPSTDEYMLNRVLQKASCWHGLVTPRSLAHHYSFRNQQDAVDAVTSPEKIRPHVLGV